MSLRSTRAPFRHPGSPVRGVWLALSLAAAALATTLSASSCGPPPSPCASTSQCDPLQACIDERCLDVDCLSNTDCSLNAFCNPETYTCDPGCSTSDDCKIGQRCAAELRQCVPRECRDTQLDCDLGERCNLATGECERDPLPYCEPCGNDDVCGATGICARLDMTGPGNCLLSCSPEAFDPCPAGLQCSQSSTADGQPDGFRCIGLCDRL